jgi:hypothetical protein
MAIPRPPPSTSELIQAGVLVVWYSNSQRFVRCHQRVPTARPRQPTLLGPPGRRIVAFLIPKGPTRKEQQTIKRSNTKRQCHDHEGTWP